MAAQDDDAWAAHSGFLTAQRGHDLRRNRTRRETDSDEDGGGQRSDEPWAQREQRDQRPGDGGD